MSRRTRADVGPLIGIPLAIGVVVLAQFMEGGHLRTLLQPTAALVVFGGTLAALILSFPMATLRRAMRDLRGVFSPPRSSTVALVAWFTEQAVRVRRSGIMSLESSIGGVDDPFLSQALELAVDGLPVDDVRLVLEQRSRAIEDRDEESAEVLEAAGGYSPTLGILGAVLGLVQVMENLAAPGKIGAGIAVAFVATIYGVAAANLMFLPLAARLRGLARTAAVTRALIVEGTISLQRGLHPRLLATHLSPTPLPLPSPSPVPGGWTKGLRPPLVIRS
jgi:chemotaxis protein MotA